MGFQEIVNGSYKAVHDPPPVDPSVAIQRLFENIPNLLSSIEQKLTMAEQSDVVDYLYM